MTEPRVELKARLATLWREAANAVDHGYERELRYEYATAQWLMEHGVTLADHRAPLPLACVQCKKPLEQTDHLCSECSKPLFAVMSAPVRLLRDIVAAKHSPALNHTSLLDDFIERAEAALSTPALPLASEEGLRAVVCYQNSPDVHPLTCGNDSSHVLWPALNLAGKPVLVCPSCSYTQAQIPGFASLSAPAERPSAGLRAAALEEAAQRERQYCNDLARRIERDIRALATPKEEK